MTEVFARTLFCVDAWLPGTVLLAFFAHQVILIESKTCVWKPRRYDKGVHCATDFLPATCHCNCHMRVRIHDVPY